MNKILSDYIKIQLQFPAEGLGKVERKRRHALLSEWQKKTYEESLPTLDELEDFRAQYGAYYNHRIFVQKVLIPLVQEDLDNGGIEGVRFLFRCFDGNESNYCHTCSPLYIFCETLDFKYQPRELVNELLKQEPDNEFALKYKYNILKYDLEFSLHEMPVGILNGMDGATINDIPKMLHSVDEFQSVSGNLGMNDYDLINSCRTLYPSYKDYLQNHTQYNGFEDYLNRRGIL